MANSGIYHVVSGVPVTRSQYESEEHHALVSGAEFPTNPVEKQLFYRIDEHRLYIYSGTAWYALNETFDVAAHATRHQYGGADEINIAGLSGEPAELTTHKGLATGVHGAGNSYLAYAASEGHIVLPFTRGWTTGKHLRGAGISTSPVEVSGWEVVSEVILSSDVQYVEFTNLNGNTDHIYILFCTTYNPSAPCTLYLYCNGDYESSHYYAQQLLVDGATVSANRFNDSRFGGSDTWSALSVMAYLLRDAMGHFRCYTFTTRSSNSISEARLVNWCIVKSDATISNLTSIRIQGSANICSGSKFILCKPRTG